LEPSGPRVTSSRSELPPMYSIASHSARRR
jgi:hypothetical protein